MKRKAPVEFSLITYRKGLSALKIGVEPPPADVSMISTMVAAAASVPSSCTSMNVWWMTLEICRGGTGVILEKSALQ